MMRRIDDRYYAWEGAVVVGDVTIGDDTTLWPFACIRGDVAPITVGARVSVQDHAMLHCRFGVPLSVGDDVVIGHHATVHCRAVGNRCLVGIGATILDDCVIGDGCLIAAGAVVRPGTEIPPGKMVAGVPARIIRDVSEQEIVYQTDVAARYVKLAQRHIAGEFPAQI